MVEFPMTYTRLAKIIHGEEQEIIKVISTEIGIQADMLTGDDLAKNILALSVKRNLLFLQPATGKNKISSEQIDEVIRFSNQRPHLSDDSIVIIKPFNSVTTEGQNKLLKLIEEPPYYLKILLLLDTPLQSAPILQTIISRCEVINLTTPVNNSLSGEWEALAIGLLAATSIDTNYKHIVATMDKLKDNNEKISFLKEIVKIVNNQLSTSGFTSKQGITRLIALQTTTDQAHKALSANANPRLVIDKLFLDLRQIV